MSHRAICILFCLCGLLSASAGLSAPQKSPTTKASATAPPAGAQLFAQHCAKCHGADLKGSGPFPPPYRTPPDLTTLSRRHGGKFPDAYVSDVLHNGVKLPAHGPAEMPVWGTDFESSEKLNKMEVAARIKALAAYIKSLQIK